MIKQAEFMFSCAEYKPNPNLTMPQIAVVGKSNVGKSSFINMLTDNGKLARVSKLPGRTRLINFFLINSSFILTDLPGYGFARVSDAEKMKWSKLIENYLAKEQNLVHILFLVDIRHEPTDDDKLMYNYMINCNIPFTIIATKSDKIPKSKLPNYVRHISSVFKVGEADVIPTSSTEKRGKDRVISKIEQIIENNPT